MYRQVSFDTKLVVLTWTGDAAGCRLTASDAAWQPFADVATALLARGVTGRVDLATVAVQGVAVAPAEADASAALRAFWSDHLRWAPTEPAITYWSFLRPGTTNGALMPDLALWRWVADAQRGYAAWREEHDLAERWASRCRAAQALVDATPRTVDWSGPAPVDLVVATPFPTGALVEPDAPPPAVLDAVEARAANFDQLHPAEPVTHVARENVMQALAGAGVFDPPDDGRRALALRDRPTLASWRRAALGWFDAAQQLPALRPAGCTHPLASPVALDWFRHGPYAGEDHSPTDWLRWHLASWMEEDRTAPGHLELFARALSARVAWQAGLGGMQQLGSAGKREVDVSWAGRCTVRAAVCTRAGHPVHGAILGALLAEREPGNWHGWMELGVALGALATSGYVAVLPFVVGGKRFDDNGAAGGARACLRHAVSLHPPLKGASVITNVVYALDDNRIFYDQPPVPLDQLPAAMLTGAEPDGVRAATARLSGSLAAYVASGGFLDDPRHGALLATLAPA